MSNSNNVIQLNGQDFVVLPLNWKQLREQRGNIIIITQMKTLANASMFTEEQQEAILSVVLAALQRKRSDITREFVEEHLDLGNVGELIQVVFGAAGFSKAEPGKGEATAATSPT